MAPSLDDFLSKGGSIWTSEVLGPDRRAVKVVVPAVTKPHQVGPVLPPPTPEVDRHLLAARIETLFQDFGWLIEDYGEDTVRFYLRAHLRTLRSRRSGETLDFWGS